MDLKIGRRSGHSRTSCVSCLKAWSPTDSPFSTPSCPALSAPFSPNSLFANLCFVSHHSSLTALTDQNGFFIFTSFVSFKAAYSCKTFFTELNYATFILEKPWTSWEILDIFSIYTFYNLFNNMQTKTDQKILKTLKPLPTVSIMWKIRLKFCRC